MKEQSRKWLLTINNPLDHGFSHDRIIDCISTLKNVNYWCLCDEIGESGTYHTHVFIYRVNQIRFSTLKNLFPQAHIDFVRGSAKENRDYIRKEGKYAGTLKEETNLKDTFKEFGDCPEERQGARTDLTELYNMIKDGLSDYEILENNPNYMRRLDEIERTRQLIRYKEFENKTRNMLVVYRFGKTGTGKSRNIIDTYGFQNVYRITDIHHPFDSYSGQDVIVFEEFYGTNWRISDMLNYLDIYPLKLPCRYNNRQACYTKVFINSNIPLGAQYTSIQKNYKDTWQAFCRRINSIEYFKSPDDIKVYGSLEEYYNSSAFYKVDDDFKQIELDFK